MREAVFGIHPSNELVSLFKSKPYQGQDPKLARVVFLSSDANYSPRISEHPFFQRILDYHADPVAFWQQTGVHHPFMLEEYPFERTKDGVPFHRKFASVGLGSDMADKISFVELLNIATMGIKSQDRARFRALADLDHLRFLKRLFTDGAKRAIFVSSSVLKDLEYLDGERWSLLNLWRKDPIRYEFDLPVIYERGGVTVFKAKHFSSSISHEELQNIRRAVVAFVGH
jgi:hypothetical protein